MKILLLSLLTLGFVHGQNLSKQRIWKVTEGKKSIYFDQGIFHSDTKSASSELTKIRNSYDASKGYERVVFDFSSSLPPKVYGHISAKENKLYVDFLNTNLKEKDIKNVSNVKYLQDLEIYDLEENLLSIEMSLTSGVTYDVFYLKNPSRVVVDIHK